MRDEHHELPAVADLRRERVGEAEEAVPAHLQQHAGQHHRDRGRRLDVRVRQPRVERDDRHLDREPGEERDEDPLLEIGLEARRDADQRQDVERLLAGVEVERQHRDQHDHGADERVDEELDRGVDPARSSPEPDEEVHREQDDLPEDVEEEEVEGAEDAEQAGLEEEEERHVRLHALLDVERVVDADDPEQAGQQDQRQREPVDPEEVVDVEGGDPVPVLDVADLAPRSRCLDATASSQTLVPDVVGRPPSADVDPLELGGPALVLAAGRRPVGARQLLELRGRHLGIVGERVDLLAERRIL